MGRFVAALAALVVVVAGCSEESKPERAKDAKITVDGKTKTTPDIECTQVDWTMTIKTTWTDSFLAVGGQEPVARNVVITDFDGFNGVAGEGAGEANLAVVNNDYVISGTAEGTAVDNPGQTKSVPFKIETSC